MGMEAIISDQDLIMADPENVRFHSTFKAIARMLIKYLPFSPGDEERYAGRLTGNALVYYQETRKAINIDTRTHRRDIVTKPLMIGIFTYFFDSDFREWFDYLVWRVLQRRDELIFPPHHLDPRTWTDNEGKRITPGLKVSKDTIVRWIEQDEIMVFRELLPVGNYWISMDIGSTTFHAVNTNYPIWCGDGWGYRLEYSYGHEETFRKNIIMGDPA